MPASAAKIKKEEKTPFRSKQKRKKKNRERMRGPCYLAKGELEGRGVSPPFRSLNPKRERGRPPSPGGRIGARKEGSAPLKLSFKAKGKKGGGRGALALLGLTYPYLLL